MSDTYGGISFPVARRGVDASVSDPLLDVTLEYFQAVLNDKLKAAWQSVAPGTLPVKTISANDPEEVDFNIKNLPTLYAWRSGGGDAPAEQIAEDIFFMRDQIQLFWVFPPARQAFRAFREQISAGAAKIIHAAIEQGRDPAWKVRGDTDTLAVSQGSVFARYAGWSEMRFKKWDDRMMNVEMADGSPKKSYPAMHMSLDVVEEFIEDITKPQYANLATGGLDHINYDPSGTLIVNERILKQP